IRLQQVAHTFQQRCKFRFHDEIVVPRGPARKSANHGKQLRPGQAVTPASHWASWRLGARGSCLTAARARPDSLKTPVQAHAKRASTYDAPALVTLAVKTCRACRRSAALIAQVVAKQGNTVVIPYPGNRRIEQGE